MQSQPLEVYIILPMSCGIFGQIDILNQYYSPVEELGYLYFIFGSYSSRSCFATHGTLLW